MTKFNNIIDEFLYNIDTQDFDDEEFDRVSPRDIASEIAENFFDEYPNWNKLTNLDRLEVKEMLVEAICSL